MRYSLFFIVRRVVSRAVSRLVRDPMVVLMVSGLVALFLLGGPSGLLSRSPAATSTTNDAAEQYMRGLRDRDAVALVDSLSPAMRRTLEQRYGRFGPGAAAALFGEQERQGERVTGYREVGRYETVQGESLRFYVVQAQRGNERRDIPYVLTIGPDGRISRVE